MPDCEQLEKCPFFNDLLDSSPGTVSVYKRRYCHGDFKRCARYMVLTRLGEDRVPRDLFPNQAEKAEKIIEKG